MKIKHIRNIVSTSSRPSRVVNHLQGQIYVTETGDILAGYCSGREARIICLLEDMSDDDIARNLGAFSELVRRSQAVWITGLEYRANSISDALTQKGYQIVEELTDSRQISIYERFKAIAQE